MKKVSILVAIIIAFATTVNAQKGTIVPKTPTKTTKPMTESEWLKQNQPKTKSTSDKSVQQPQPVGVQDGGEFLPQPVYDASKVVDMQWIRKMINGKKYTIKLIWSPYSNSGIQNILMVTIEDFKNPSEAKTVQIFHIAEDMEDPVLEQTADWKKLTFTYELGGITVPIEIENLY